MKICPICKGKFEKNQGALSRRDNKTIICSYCGTIEALEDFANALRKAGIKEK